MRIILPFLFVSLLSTCADTTPLQVMQGLLGYIPTPEETSIAEEIELEFNRCEKIDPDRNCAQIAYNMVRTVKGLEPRKVPKGVVIILEGDVDLESENNETPVSPQSDNK